MDMSIKLNTNSSEVLAGFILAHGGRLFAQSREAALRAEEKQMRDRIMADMGYHVVGVPHMPENLQEGGPVLVVIDPTQNPGLSSEPSCENTMYRRRPQPFIEEINETFVISDVRFKRDRSPNKGLKLGSYNSKSRRR